jgi:hypothetical protein
MEFKRFLSIMARLLALILLLNFGDSPRAFEIKDTVEDLSTDMAYTTPKSFFGRSQFSSSFAEENMAGFNFHNSEIYDPSFMREEPGLNKQALLGMVYLKSLINAFRVVYKETNFIPILDVDKNSASLSIQINF